LANNRQAFSPRLSSLLTRPWNRFDAADGMKSGFLYFTFAGETILDRRKSLQIKQKKEEIMKKAWSRTIVPAIALGFLLQSAAIAGDNTAGDLSEEDGKKIARIMADMRSIATACEAYGVDNHQYPKARPGKLVKVAKIRKQLQPTYIRKLPLIDEWGRPFLFQANKDRTEYYIVCTGKDGKLDKPMSDVVFGTQTKKGNSDIIFCTGSFVQWPDKSLWEKPEKMTGEAPAFSDDIEKQKNAMLNIRTIAICCEAFAVDNNKYPKARPGELVLVEELKDQLEPIYVKTLPLVDGWGNPYYFTTTAERTTYYVISVGKDGKLDKPLDEVTTGTTIDRFDGDIVFKDGAFIQWPEGEQR
jgi:hypothetical protein